MARPRKFNPLTNAERQAAYRERKKAEGLKRQSGWVDPQAPAVEAAQPSKAQLLKGWQEELKAEELKAARQSGRQKERAKFEAKGYFTAMAMACKYFMNHDRPDITRSLMQEFLLTRDKFTKAQVDQMYISQFDKAGIFDPPDNQS